MARKSKRYWARRRLKLAKRIRRKRRKLPLAFRRALSAARRAARHRLRKARRKAHARRRYYQINKYGLYDIFSSKGRMIRKSASSPGGAWPAPSSLHRPRKRRR